MAQLFLGLDSSTQSLSAIVIDYEARQIVYEGGIVFDEALPGYRTENGVLRDEESHQVHSPPRMWLDALDLLMRKMVDDGVDLASVAGISGSGQQHGTVYLNSHAKKAVAHLDPALSLNDNLKNAFSRKTSPVWMDSSTTRECEEIRAALGGMQAVTEATGSNTFERFSGPQIRKFFKDQPEAYAETAQIALVSSFLASVMAGQTAPIDYGDGAGMNLMDIAARDWHPEALAATADHLGKRLPKLSASDRVMGPVSRYFAAKYGLSAEARAVVWSGDNPNSVVGVGLVHPGMVAISLGTSDTYFGTMAECRTDPNGEGHVFGSPTGDYMTLICFKNGSLARERIAESFGLDWDGFSRALQDTPPGNAGKLLLPYYEPEIVPHVLKAGVRRRHLKETDGPGHCRAVVEAQMMSMRIHSEWMGIKPSQIYATGGASANQDILQIMANVHQCPVHRFNVTNSAALGAALRAAHAVLHEAGDMVSWEDCVAGFTDPVAGSAIDPDMATAPVYDKLVQAYRLFEQEAVSE